MLKKLGSISQKGETVGEDGEVREGGKVVVRLVTTYWVSQRGLHTKKDIIFLKRKSEGFNWLEEDSLMSGCDMVFPLIVNLEECADGIYEVIMVNETKDWESGHVESWEYKLVPFTEKND